MKTTLFFMTIMLFLSPVVSLAVEVAPRISDREIIEALSELKAGQVTLDKRLDDMNRSIDKRLDDMNRSIDKRFEDINRRIDGLQNTMLALFGAILSLIVALFGFIIWDRRTMLRPVVDRLDRLEREVT